jgi:hypothetical protein
MFNPLLMRRGLPTLLLALLALPAGAQSFRVQCPTGTITHPAATPTTNDVEPAYTGPTVLASTVPGETTPINGYMVPTAKVNGAIKCQQISGGDGYSTMGDGTQTYMFSFGPLSGLANIASGLPGTVSPSVFNSPYLPNGISGSLPPGYPASTTVGPPLVPGDPAATIVVPTGSPSIPQPALTAGQLSALAGFYNGAIGQAPNIANLVSIYDIAQDPPTSATPHRVTVQTNSPLGVRVGDKINITGTGLAYDGPQTVTGVGLPSPLPSTVINYGFTTNFNFTFDAAATGLAVVNTSQTAIASLPPQIDGHVDPRQIMDIGVMNGNIPAPLMAIDEDDEYFLTLTNVGMIMRPDLFEQHTVHFHGYPNASSFYDGVPDASVAISIAASFTYYYLAPDAGTYFWHCHITPPEHLQMGMVGQLYVRPRQNRVPAGTTLYSSLQAQQADLRTACNSATDILCSNPLPAMNTGAQGGGKYAYNDGDGSTAYDVEYPLQIHGFDPNFHFVGMTFNPEGFADMKDKYFLLNGRSYPDTVTPGPLQTVSSDGSNHFSQPLPAIITITAGQRALLRISDLDVSEYQTLASLGIPMTVIGYNAKLLRDQAGNNMYYNTNSITLGGGESLDVILDTCQVRAATGACTTTIPAGTYYLYTPNLDHLSNDAENFGGLMTEVHVI